jgi:hypothetical protein
LADLLSDPDYLQFLESLSQPAPAIPSAEEQLDKRIAAGRETIISPLLQFLLDKKALKAQKLEQAKKERAERRKAEKKANANPNANTNPNPKTSDEKVPKKFLLTLIFSET